MRAILESLWARIRSIFGRQTDTSRVIPPKLMPNSKRILPPADNVDLEEESVRDMDEKG